MTATPAPAAGGQGAAALAAAPAAPAAAPAAASGESATPPAAAPASDWTSGLPDDARGYVQNKGWKGPSDLLTSYQNLEKLHGAPPERILKLPEKPDDAEGWGKVYQRLGVPERPDLYKFEGVDGDDAKLLGELAHKSRLTQEGANEFLSGLRAHTEAKRQQANEKFLQQSELDMKSLRQEWGQSYDEQIELGRRGIKSLGIDAGKLDALERVLGTKAMLQMFAKVGSFGAEATAHGLARGEQGSGFGLTPEAARQRIAALRNDKEWVGKLMSGDANVKAESDRLHRIAYG